MDIKETSLDKIWEMRHIVMYPQESLDFVKLEEDDNGLHLGLYVDDELVSVISLFENGEEVQFRKFATSIPLQGKGYGSQLLKYVMEWTVQNNKKKIWCNARVTATALYEKVGMTAVGEGWKKYGFDFIKMEKQFI